MPNGPEPIEHAGNTERGTVRARLPAMIWLLGGVAFLMGTSELMVAGLLPQISAAMNVTLSQTGLLITVFALGMMIGAPVMALATIRLPRNATLILALLVFALAHIVAALTPIFELLLFARFVAAVACGTFWAVGAVVATTAAGVAARARAMGVMVGGVTLANVVGVPLGTVLGQVVGWQGPFLILALSSLASAFALWLRLPRTPPASHRTRVAAELGLLRSGRLWLVYSLITIVQASFGAVYSFVAPLLIEGANMPRTAVPLVLLGYGLGALTGNMLGARFGDKHPFAVLIPATVGLICTIAAMLLWAQNGLALALLFLLLGVFALIGNPVLGAQAVRATGGRGVLPMSLVVSSFNLGIAAGSWLGGASLAAISLQGPPTVALVLAGLSLLLVTALALVSRHTDRSTQRGGRRDSPVRDEHVLDVDAD